MASDEDLMSSDNVSSGLVPSEKFNMIYDDTEIDAAHYVTSTQNENDIAFIPSPKSAKKRSFSESDLPVVLKKLKLTTDCSKEDDFGTSENTISTTKNSKKRRSSETDGDTSQKIMRPTVDDGNGGTISSTTAPH